MINKTTELLKKLGVLQLILQELGLKFVIRNIVLYC